MHGKDVRAEVLARVRAEDMSFLDGVVAGMFTVPGDGCIDFGSVLSRLEGAGYDGWLVVEAEQGPEWANPLGYAREGHDYLLRAARHAGMTIAGRGRIGMVSFALIGAGRIGRLHAGNLAADPGIRFTAVADVVAAAAEEVATAHGARADSVEDAVIGADIDAVLIASSTDSHADLIERAARAGKAILCEKPIDLDTNARAGRSRSPRIAAYHWESASTALRR